MHMLFPQYHLQINIILSEFFQDSLNSSALTSCLFFILSYIIQVSVKIVKKTRSFLGGFVFNRYIKDF